MKKTYKILIIFLVVVFLLSGLVWWQFENVRAIYYWLKYSDSDIDTMLSENFTKVETYLEENSKYQVRPSSPVEEELHQKGAINDDELVGLITNQTTIKEMFGADLELDENKKITITESGEKISLEDANQLKQDAASSAESSASNKSDMGSDGGKTEPAKPENSDVSSCIAQVYVIKSKFVGELDVIYNQAFSEYKALWRGMTEEQRTAKKKELLNEVYPRASALEKDCDTQMNDLLGKLTKLLKESGEGTGLVDQIRESYYNEKSLKKAHYLSLLT